MDGELKAVQARWQRLQQMFQGKSLEELVTLTQREDMAMLLGCSTLRLNPFASESLVPPIHTPEAIGQCDVEFKPDKGASKKTTVALQPETTVQQVLIGSGALRKFAKKEIELVRKLPNGSDHRMAVDFDRSTRHVETGFDYQVRPGDHLIVREDLSTILDDMLENALGPWVGKSKKQSEERMREMTKDQKE